MAFYDKFPYTNFQELNLDRLIHEMMEVKEGLQFVIDNSSLKYADPIQWNISRQYAANTVVIDPESGIAYISTKPVPDNILITNTEYWTPIFDLSPFFDETESSISQLQTITTEHETEINALENTTNTHTTQIAELENAISDQKDPTYLNVTDYDILPNTGEDVYLQIQQLIDNNPGKTIFFPDGEYMTSQPIHVYGATDRTVFLKLSPRAVIKASDTNTDYVIEIGTGGTDGNSSVWVNGGLTGIEGGCIDCNAVSGGIHIITGIQAPVIRNLTIRRLRKTGIRIEYGINNGSADVLCENVKIFGIYQFTTNTPDSIGIDCAAYDNNFRNIIIIGVWLGVKLTGAGNQLSNVHNVFAQSDTGNAYVNTRSFDVKGFQIFESCYSDGTARGWWFRDNNTSFLTNCTIHWYQNAAFTRQFAFWANDALSIKGQNIRINFETVTDAQYSGLILENGAISGLEYGMLDNVMINDESKIPSNDPIRPLIKGMQFGIGDANGVGYSFRRMDYRTYEILLNGTSTSTGTFTLDFPRFTAVSPGNRATSALPDLSTGAPIAAVKWFSGDSTKPQLVIYRATYIVGTLILQV